MRVKAPIAPIAHSSALGYIMRCCLKHAELPLPPRGHRGMHSLRHSLATEMLRCGTSLHTISAVLGHTSSESTRPYTRVDIEALRSVCLSPAVESVRGAL